MLREYAAAIVCALSVLVALVAGSALRTHYTGNALPEPGSWTHVAGPAWRLDQQTQSVIAGPSLSAMTARVDPGAAPRAGKPFRNVWMTRDVPSRGDLLLSNTGGLELATSFAAVKGQSRGTPVEGVPAQASTRHTLSLFCIIRC